MIMANQSGINIPGLLIFCFFLITVGGCKKLFEGKPYMDYSYKSFKDPGFYKDTLGLGEFPTGLALEKIIISGLFNRGVIMFDYYAGTDKIKTIAFGGERHPNSCDTFWYEFFYRDDRIEYVTENFPNEYCKYVSVWHKYYYYPSGALKSILQENPPKNGPHEYYFSYNSDGRVDRIFLLTDYDGSAGPGVTINYYKYDSSGNVSERRFQPPRENYIEEVTTFKYDNSVNPFRHIFYLYSRCACDEAFGPDFLSGNTVVERTRTYPSTSNTHILPYILETQSRVLKSCSDGARKRTFVYR